MKDKILIAISILLLGGWCCILIKNVFSEYRTPNSWEMNFPTSSIRFTSGGAGKLNTGLPVWGGDILSAGHRSMLSLHTSNHNAGMGQTVYSPMPSGAVEAKVYSTASVSPHWYGGGTSGFKGDDGQSTRNGHENMRSINDYSPMYGWYTLNPRTFIAMSSQVRNSAEEFEYGENAIGADSPRPVIRRTPGSGPVTDDPEHQPTVVTPTPIGNGLYVLLILATCYCFSCLSKRNKEEV